MWKKSECLCQRDRHEISRGMHKKILGLFGGNVIKRNKGTKQQSSPGDFIAPVGISLRRRNPEEAP